MKFMKIRYVQVRIDRCSVLKKSLAFFKLVRNDARGALVFYVGIY